MLQLLLLCINLSVSLAFWSWYDEGLADCSHGHVKLDGICYILAEGKNTWHDAKEMCQQNGMTLARVDSPKKHETVSQFLSTKFNRHTWIWLDIKYDSTLGVYVHNSNNNEVNASYWNPGEPNSDNEECVAHHARGWIDLQCSVELNFLCQMQGCTCSGDQVYTPETTHCTNGRLYFGGDTCYHINETSVRYDDAKASCEANGGKLARLNYETKYDDLFSYIENLPYGRWKSFWAAAKRNLDTEKFEYEDGTVVESTEIWSENEPNNYMDSEHCAQSWYSYPSGTYKWNDADCNGQIGYICEFEDCDRDICLSTTSAPTTTSPTTSTPATTGSPTDSPTDESSDKTTRQPSAVNDGPTTGSKQEDDGSSFLDMLKSKGQVVCATSMTLVLCCLALFI